MVFIFQFVNMVYHIMSPFCSLELLIQSIYLSLSSLPVASLLSSLNYKASSDNHFAFFHFFFFGIVLVIAWCTML